MDVVADGLDAAGAGGRCAEQVPRDAGQPIGLAVSAAEEEDERLLGKIFHRVLVLRQGDRVGLAGVVQQRTGRQSQPARRRKQCGCTSCQSHPCRTSWGRTAPRSSGRERRCRRRACDGCSTSAPSASVADSRRSARSQRGSAWSSSSHSPKGSHSCFSLRWKPVMKAELRSVESTTDRSRLQHAPVELARQRQSVPEHSVHAAATEPASADGASSSAAGVTLTPTWSVWSRPPSTTPRSGLTSP